jgi:hypothetical protein
VDGCVEPQEIGEEAAAAAERHNCSAERAPKSHDSHDSPKSSRWTDGSATGILHLRAGLGARHEELPPSARQVILTAGPWVSHPWFEQFCVR